MRILKKGILRTNINKLKETIAPYFPYRTFPGNLETLEREYVAGKWDRLVGLEQLGRFSIIAGYCRYFKKGPAILDLGCGEGFLEQSISPAEYKRFVGVDIAPEAIRRANRTANGKSSFFAEDAMTFVPDSKFDIIVFTEVINYFPEPVKEMKRYEQYLEADGLFISSVFNNHWYSAQIDRMIKQNFEVISQTHLANMHDQHFTVTVFKPGRK